MPPACFLTPFSSPFRCTKRRGIQMDTSHRNGSDSIHIPGRDASEIGEGLSRGLKTCHRHVFLTPFSSPFWRTKKAPPRGAALFWYARRDSNPQPSEPESDALSIEPLAHALFSGCIIADLARFVKRRRGKFFPVSTGNRRKKRLFSFFSCDIIEEIRRIRRIFGDGTAQSVSLLF